MKKGQGHIIYEKNGEKHSISDKRFLRFNKKGFSRCERASSNQVLHIYIEDADITNIEFIDCDFDLSNRNIWQLNIHLNAKNANPTFIGCNFGPYNTECVIKAKNNIALKRSHGEGNIKINANEITIESLLDSEIEFKANNITIKGYQSVANDTKMELIARKKLVMHGVLLETVKPIIIDTPDFEYKNISLMSTVIKMSNFFNSTKMNARKYIINDETLEAINSMNQFKSVLSGLHDIVTNQVNEQIKKIEGQKEQHIQESVVSKIQELQDELKRLRKLKADTIKNAKNNLEEKSIKHHINKKVKK